jgi:hypothetical protein
MASKDPPCDVNIEFSSGSPLSKRQLELYEDIREVYRRYRGETSLRVYYVGCDEPPNLPWRRNTPGRKKRKK